MNMASVSPTPSSSTASASIAAAAGMPSGRNSIAQHQTPSVRGMQASVGNKIVPSALHAEDWKYLAEGGHHVVVAYEPVNRTKTPDDYYDNNDSDTETQDDGDTKGSDAEAECRGICFGRVLRISKEDFILASSNALSTTSSHSRHSRKNGISNSTGNRHSADFLTDVVGPRLQPYLDTPSKLKLHPSFLQKLYHRIIEHVPESRKDDWKGFASVEDVVSTASASDASAAAVEPTPEQEQQQTQPDFYGDLHGYCIDATMHFNYKQIYALATPQLSTSGSASAKGTTTTSSIRPLLQQPHNSHNKHLLAQEPSKPTTSICLEIKPKAGYITTSPLVHPDHRSKFNHTRFQILQQLHSKGVITKGWNKFELQQMSDYNPMELFSTKKKKSLEHLFDSPQNNLRVWYNKDTLLYGENVHHNLEGEDSTNSISTSGEDENIIVDSSIYRQALAKVFDEYVCESDDQATTNTTTNSTTFKSKLELRRQLVNMTTHILNNENFLSKLLRLQLLDILDADGAILVYDHLVSMFDGNADDVEDYLDDPGTLLKYEDTSWEHRLPLLSASPFSLPTDCSGLWPLCVEIDSFSRKLVSPETRRTLLDDEDELDRIRNRAISHIHTLSKEECRYLLQNWLLSLSMCDISFFITISPAESLDMDMHHNRRSSRRRMVSDFADDKLETLHHQGSLNGQEGILVDSDGSAWYYTIKAVDCDQKPARKLRHRAESESAIKHFEETKK